MRQFSYSNMALFLSFLFLMFLTNSCAPVFSEMQSAGTVGEGKMDGTVSYSSVGFSGEGESGHVQKHIDAQAAFGISENIDIRSRYSYVWVKGEDVGSIDDVSINILSFGPKFSFIKNRLSAYLPIGFAFGEDISSSETFQIHPTILGTYPITNRVEINPSAKVLFPLNENGGDTTIAFNLGLGFDITNGIKLRPEYGILFNPGEDGHFSHFGIGLTFSSAEPKAMSDSK